MNSNHKTLRLLVVDNNEAHINLSETLGASHDHQIEAVVDPEKALALITDGEEKYDAVLIAASRASEFAHQLKGSERRVDQLESLRRTALAIAASLELNTVLSKILKHAVELLRAKNGGVYKYDAAHDELAVIADQEHPEHINTTLSQGMALNLVRVGRAYEIAHDYQKPADSSSSHDEKHSHAAVLEVPLKWHGQNIGVLYIEDEVGRHFTPEDAHVVGLFADQAAATLGHAEMNAIDLSRLRGLEKLSQATKEIVSNLGTTSLDDRLTLIARHATEILEAEVCNVLLVSQDGVLRLAASYGHREGGFKKGKEFIIRSGHKTGLIGHIAHERRLFNAHGERLRQHFAVRGERPPHLRSGMCHSLLAVPLKKTLDGEERLIGLLCAENKKDAHHQPLVALEFSEVDEWILQLFGEAVVVALDSATLVRELRGQKEHLDQRVELTKRREHLLTALTEASLRIRAEREPDKLLHEVARLAAEMVGCNHGGLYITVPALKVLELKVALDIDKEHTRERIRYETGLSGRAATTGKFQVARNLSGLEASETGLDLPALKTFAAIPLKSETSEVDAVLFVASDDPEKHLNATDIEMLERFAAQAAIALQTARLVNRDGRTFERLSILHKISQYLQSAKDLPGLFHVLLTGVTADYGLRFNRAAVFTMEGQEEVLVGKFGIGHFEERVAREDWVRDQEYGVNNFSRYIEMLEQDALPLTPLGKKIKNLRIPVGGDHHDLFSRVLREKVPVRAEEKDWPHLPASLIETFEPSSPLAIVPLEVPGQTLGLLVVDNKFTRAPITDEDLNLLHTFANAAAIAIHNITLLHEKQMARERLAALFNASNALISSQDPHRVLKEIVEQPPVAADGAWVRIIFIDEMGQPWKQIFGGTKKTLQLKNSIRPDGISVQVMKTGVPVVIEDTNLERHRVNPFVLQAGIGAALCLPFSIYGESVGVMWINYPKPRTFQSYETHALQLYANHAAIAYDKATEMEELVSLHEAAQTMAAAVNPRERQQTSQTTVKHVQQTIVETAQETFSAISSTLWSYDQGQGQFLPNELHAVGIPQTDLQIFRDEEPYPDGTTYKVLKDGWVPVEDVADPHYEFLRPEMREYLQRSGVRSFQGVALRVGQEPVGVLYVSYKRPRRFTDKDRGLMTSFANYAALSLKNARLVDQVITGKLVAEVFAGDLVLGDHDKSLQSIADATKDVVGCDAVVLYAYDTKKQTFSYPPRHAGVNYPQRAWPGTMVPPTSILYDIIEHQEPVIVEEVQKHEHFHRRFANEEEIASFIAIPLRAGANRKKVGVMFVNYRAHHRFRADELASIKLFASKAAAAIRNWQVYQHRNKQLGEQKALVKLSREFLETDNVQETMNRGLAVAAEMLGADFCNIVTPDENGKLIFKAAWGWEESMVNTFVVPSGTGSQTGFTMLTHETVAVEDYSNMEGSGFVVPSIVYERDIKSGLSVPMFNGNEVFGAMLTHFKTKRQFDDEDKNLLRVIANQTALAVKSAQRFESLDIKRRSMVALYEASTALSKSFGSKSNYVLDRIVEQAVTGITKAVMGTLQLYNEERNELHFVSVYPPHKHTELVERLGERRSLDPLTARDGKIGVTGRTILEGQPQLVTDINEVADYYIPFNERTQSELTVPLHDEGKVIGVLNVESDQLAGFDKDDQMALRVFSDMAVTTLKNAQYLDELKRTKRIIGSRTALAWMGLASSHWWHGIGNQASHICDTVDLIRLQAAQFGKLPGWIDEDLDQIHVEAQAILKDSLMPPLSSEEETTEFNLNELVTTRLHALWKKEPYKSITLREQSDPSQTIFVLAGYHWIQGAFDQLIDNAVREVKSLAPDRHLVEVNTRIVDDMAEIDVTDRGGGIPDQVVSQLFGGQVDSQKKSKGLGMGLLMAEAIVENYGGEIEVRSTGPEGTSMVIRLPYQGPQR